MSKGKHEKGKGLAVGAALGAVAGVVTGVLFAPKSGRETRKDISDTAVKTKAKLLEEAKKANVEMHKVIDKVEVMAREKGTVVSDKAKEALTNAKQARDNLSTKAEDLKAGKNSDDQDLKQALKKAEEAQTALQKFLKK